MESQCQWHADAVELIRSHHKQTIHQVFCFEMKLIQCVDVSNVIKSIQASVYNGDTFTIPRDAFMVGLEVLEFVRRSTRDS